MQYLKCALVYDFDGTLARGFCVEHGLMPALGLNDKVQFWDDVAARARADDADDVLAYMGALAECANQQGSRELSPDNLHKHGATIPLFPGVVGWFDRINAYAERNNILLEHYVVSSGLLEMIQGTEIALHFKKIYASQFHYAEDGEQAIWPSLAINCSTKTQFLYRINKGIQNSWSQTDINRFIEPHKREVPFERMIFLGDGNFDIPSMKMLCSKGGHSIAVFDDSSWEHSSIQEKVEQLIADERANYVVPTLYNEGSQLDLTVKGLLQLIKRKHLIQQGE